MSSGTENTSPAGAARMSTDLMTTPTSPGPDAAAGERQPRRSLVLVPRHVVELQLRTVAGYSRRRKLRAPRWTCCHCGRKQPYRGEVEDDGEGDGDGDPTTDAAAASRGGACARVGPLAGLRCADPTCGVSGRGFRICRVHESEFFLFFLSFSLWKFQISLLVCLFVFS